MAAGWPKYIKSHEEEKVGGDLFYMDYHPVPNTAGTPLSACQRYSIADGSLIKIVLQLLFVGILIFTENQ